LLSEAADHIFSKAKDRVYRILTMEQYQKRLTQASSSSAAVSSNPPIAIAYPESLSLDYVLYPILEVPPKWRVLKQIMHEIQQSRSKVHDDSSLHLDMKRKHRVIIIVRDELTQSQLNDYLSYDESIVMDQRYRWFISQQVAEIKQQLLSAMKNAKRSRTIASSSSSIPTDDETSSSYLGLGITQRQFDSLSLEEKLLLLEEQRLHKISSEKHGSNILSESSALDASLANEIMTAPIDDEEGDNDDDFEADQPSSRSKDNNNNKRKAAAMDSSTASQTTKKKSNESTQAKSVKKGAPIRSQAISAEVFDGDCQGYSFDWSRACPAGTDENVSSLLRSDSMAIFVTHSEATSSYCNILEELQPDHVVMYDGDISLIRMIESYHINLRNRPAIKVYYTYYDDSAEKHRYADSLSREKRAFESLSSLISGGIISSIALPDSLAELSAAKVEDQTIIRDSRLIQREYDFRTPETSSSSTATAAAAAVKRQNNPLAMIRREVKSSGPTADNVPVAGIPHDSESAKPIVVVDIREFRSALPSLLHAAGYRIIPRTLTVGDYVLAAEIVVERKGISDLFQSFASGRLYNQVSSS
jgi:DNA excision repair protein ERCC-4